MGWRFIVDSGRRMVLRFISWIKWNKYWTPVWVEAIVMIETQNIYWYHTPLSHPNSIVDILRNKAARGDEATVSKWTITTNPPHNRSNKPKRRSRRRCSVSFHLDRLNIPLHFPIRYRLLPKPDLMHPCTRKMVHKRIAKHLPRHTPLLHHLTHRIPQVLRQPFTISGFFTFTQWRDRQLQLLLDTA